MVHEFKMSTVGQFGNIEIDVKVKINRELNSTDNYEINQGIRKMINSLISESLSMSDEIKKEVSEQREKIIALFGDNSIFVEEIPNQYDMESTYFRHFPWFIVTTKKGRIKIGWRKRVINIDWMDSIVNDDAETLFPKEDVTKFTRVIHAWGYEKAKEYLDVILK